MILVCSDVIHSTTPNTYSASSTMRLIRVMKKVMTSLIVQYSLNPSSVIQIINQAEALMCFRGLESNRKNPVQHGIA